MLAAMETTPRTILKSYWDNKKFWQRQLLAWLIVFAVFVGLNLLLNGTATAEEIQSFVIITGVIILVFYSAFFGSALYLGRKTGKFIAWLLISFGMYLLLVRFAARQQYDQLPAAQQQDWQLYLFRYLFLSSIYYVLFTAIAIAYWSMRNAAIRKRENMRTEALLVSKNLELEQQKLLLQKELLESENNFLRAQINPHFLYNCLNHFYAETLEQQPQVAESIMLLSQIMRYSITDFSANGGLANLDEEIEHISHVVALNKFRFPGRLNIDLDLQGDTTGKKIAPMLLITLVENIFKHGDLRDASTPALVSCTVEKESKTIRFTTCNKKNKSVAVSSSGVGITNVRQRLRLLYKEQAELQVTDGEKEFTTILILPYFDNQ